jgi:ankyrin repeat protein
MTPLHYASQRAHREVVRLLLSKGASKERCDISGRNGFLYAAERGDVELLRLLIPEDKNYSFADHSGVTAMHIAAEGNNKKIMVFLKMSCNGSCSIKNNNKKRPIHFAAESGAEDVMDFYLEQLIVHYRKELKTKYSDTRLEEEIKKMLSNYWDTFQFYLPMIKLKVNLPDLNN